MDETALKDEIIDKIEHSDLNQLKEIYGWLVNYFNGQESGWDALPESHRKGILRGLEEADAGLGRPAAEVSVRLRAKYGLDG
jgi:hypothetical protein